MPSGSWIGRVNNLTDEIQHCTEISVTTSETDILDTLGVDKLQGVVISVFDTTTGAFIRVQVNEIPETFDASHGIRCDFEHEFVYKSDSDITSLKVISGTGSTITKVQVLGLGFA